MSRVAALLCLISLVACGPSRPDLASQISPGARAEGYPALLPLGPLLASTDEMQPRTAETEGLTLEARAADLRRRADALRRLPL